MVEKHHTPLVEDVLQILQYFACNQGMVCKGTEGLCMLLKLTTVSFAVRSFIEWLFSDNYCKYFKFRKIGLG